MKTIKEVDINKASIIKILIFFKKNIFIICTFILFYIFYIFTQDIFSNEYILESFIENKAYSRQCLTLVDNKELPNDIYNFFIKNNIKNNLIPVFFNSIPKSLALENDEKRKKYIFINILTPLIMKYNNETIKDRESIVAINYKLLSEPLDDNDFNTIKLLSSKYNIMMQGENFWDYTSALEELLVNIDIIPNALLLSIFAKETKWGQSQQLLNYNALIPNILNNESSKKRLFINNGEPYIKNFSNLEESIKYYYHIVNTSDNYKNFRKVRYQMRGENSFNILRLTKVFLADFKKQDALYVDEISNIVINNNSLFYKDDADYNQKYNSICLNIK